MNRRVSVSVGPMGGQFAHVVPGAEDLAGRGNDDDADGRVAGGRVNRLLQRVEHGVGQCVRGLRGKGQAQDPVRLVAEQDFTADKFRRT